MCGHERPPRRQNLIRRAIETSFGVCVEASKKLNVGLIRIEQMKRDDLIKEMRVQAGTWQALLIVYAVIVGTMVLSAMAIV